MSEERLGLFEFPCQFPIKAMGKAEIEFDLLVIDIIAQYVDELSADAVKTRPSKNGKYLSVTVTIEATSQQQLDDIYQQLSDHPRVLMAL
jgi:putative lipoic acid-binding regulatory protein